MDIVDILKVVKNIAKTVEVVVDIFTDQEGISMELIRAFNIVFKVVGGIVTIISAVSE